MKGLLILSLAAGVLLTACGSHPQPVLERVEAPPPRHVPNPVERMGTAGGGTVDEEASRAFIQREIERRAAEAPIKEPPPRRTVYVPYSGYASDLRDHEYRYDYRTYQASPYYGYRPYYRGSRFPLGSTLFGAGLGAIIGHQSGRRDRGAAIGAGIGYLFGR